MALNVGQSVGNYRVVKKLGSGGMGAVYLAEHPLIGKKVALKVLNRDLSADREVVTRFFNEARAVNQIGNEHIVDISDFGQTTDGDHFFVRFHFHDMVTFGDGTFAPNYPLLNRIPFGVATVVAPTRSSNL